MNINGSSAIHSASTSTSLRRSNRAYRRGLPAPEPAQRNDALRRVWAAARGEPGLGELRRLAARTGDAREQRGGHHPDPPWEVPRIPPPVGGGAHSGLRRVAGLPWCV